MILNIAIIFVIILNILEKINTYSLNSNLARNKQDLIDIIKSLNDGNDKRIDKGNYYKTADKEKSLELPDDEKERILQQMLWLFKKNFNAAKQYDELIKNPIHSGSRLYFIKNPEVLDEYKEYLKTKNLPLKYEDTDRQRKEANAKLKELKRRAEFRTGSSDQSEAKDFDRVESREDYKDTINETSEKSIETTQNILDFIQDKQSLNNEDIMEKTENINLEANEEQLNIDKTKDVTIEKHNIRAQEGNSDNIVRREKIEWTDTNDKTDIDTKKIKKSEKMYTSRKNKHKNNDDRKEKRVFDDYKHDEYVPYKPKPKINYRKPKNEGKKDFFSYGRTSIPFIGKKGIYEDK